MTEKCELLDTCEFFLNFNKNLDVIKNGWIRAYCEDMKKSDYCKRKEYRKETGTMPATNMTPTGELLK